MFNNGFDLHGRAGQYGEDSYLTYDDHATGGADYIGDLDPIDFDSDDDYPYPGYLD